MGATAGLSSSARIARVDKPPAWHAGRRLCRGRRSHGQEVLVLSRRRRAWRGGRNPCRSFPHNSNWTCRIRSLQLAVQTGRKNAQETAGVADGFDDIRLQLVNNRIDSEALRLRLGAGIIQPLHKIVEQMFPELERRLEALEAAVADPNRGSECPELAHAAQKQADDILLAMQAVLNHMLEMLDYNQMVEQLRNLIKQQEQIIQHTKERQKSRVRELLEK